MKYFSMFSGIGGFELGINRAFSNIKSDLLQGLSDEGTTCVGYSEVDKYAIKCYENHFQGHKNYGDATRINADELPDFDILCGGFPCQAFSIAGKRGGFSDVRGTMFFEIARILRVKRPKYILLENVKGLLSHESGRTYATIKNTLEELGYVTQRQTLNSKNFGVPQNRERVFIVGCLGGFGGREIFPIRENDNPLTTKGGATASDAVISRTLTATDAKMHLDGNYIKRIIKQSQSMPDAQRIREIDGVSVTLKGEGGGQGAKTGLYAIPLKFLGRNQKTYQGDYSFTVDSVNTGGIMKDYRIRRLTPTECERLQGFPDGWTDGISDSQRYKCLGNAVTVNVVQAVIERMYALSTH